MQWTRPSAIVYGFSSAPAGPLNFVFGGGGPERNGRDLYAQLLQNAVRSHFVHQKMPGLLAKINSEDLATLAYLVQRGTVIPVVDRTYPLREIANALRDVEAGHVCGKVVIAVA